MKNYNKKNIFDAIAIEKPDGSPSVEVDDDVEGVTKYPRQNNQGVINPEEHRKLILEKDDLTKKLSDYLEELDTLRQQKSNITTLENEIKTLKEELVKISNENKNLKAENKKMIDNTASNVVYSNNDTKTKKDEHEEQIEKSFMMSTKTVQANSYYPSWN